MIQEFILHTKSSYCYCFSMIKFSIIYILYGLLYVIHTTISLVGNTCFSSYKNKMEVVHWFFILLLHHKSPFPPPTFPFLTSQYHAQHQYIPHSPKKKTQISISYKWTPYQ